MKSYRKELWFNVPTRRAFINITSQVEGVFAGEWGCGGVGVSECDAYYGVCLH